MAIYQGTPLPRTRANPTVPRQPPVSGRATARTTTSVRTPSRPATPMHGTLLPRAAVPREQPARHAVRLRVVAAPRPRTAMTGVAIVLALTFVALFYVSQTFEAAAARYEVDALLVERQALLMELKSQQGSTVRWGSEQQVTQWARDTELYRLGQRYRVRAR